MPSGDERVGGTVALEGDELYERSDGPARCESVFLTRTRSRTLSGTEQGTLAGEPASPSTTEKVEYPDIGRRRENETEQGTRVHWSEMEVYEIPHKWVLLAIKI